MKTCIIDIGGGLKDIYAAGVFDYCLDNKITFDICIGISAGSANVASFVAGQRGKSYIFYTKYSFRKQCMSLFNFITKKSYLDLDYIYSTLCNHDGETPFDFEKFKKSSSDVVIIATNAQTGRPKYFYKKDMSQDNYDILKASSAVPFLCQPYYINKVAYYDGAISDTIPIEKALEENCDKIVLILPRPRNIVRSPKADVFVAHRIQEKYPIIASKLSAHSYKYSIGIKIAKKYEKLGKVLILAPDDTCGVYLIKKNYRSLNELYKKGYKDAKAIKNFLKDE